MNYSQENPYQTFGLEGQFAAYADESARTTFIRRTYLHLAAAIMGFIAIEAVIFAVVPAATLDNVLAWIATTRFGWLLVLGAFVGVSWIAQSWATSSTSLSTQYMGLGLYVVAQAAIFVPLLHLASQVEGVIPAAAIITGVVFTGLTILMFMTRADVSWLGKYLALAMFGALGVIIVSMIFQFSLGILFTGAMIVLASGLHSVRHVERDAPLPDGSVRSRRTCTVRRGRTAVLVRAAVRAADESALAGAPRSSFPWPRVPCRMADWPRATVGRSDQCLSHAPIVPAFFDRC